MPRSTREWAKRKLQAAEGAAENCFAHLFEIHQRYDEQHPEVSGTLEKAIELIGLAKEVIEWQRNNL